MSFNVNDIMSGQLDLEEIANQSDAEVQAGSTSNHMDFIRRNTNRGGVRQIPNALQQLESKNSKEIQKYIILGAALYLLCC